MAPSISRSASASDDSCFGFQRDSWPRLCGLHIAQDRSLFLCRFLISLRLDDHRNLGLTRPFQDPLPARHLGGGFGCCEVLPPL
jgi:hypothetical protein